MSKCVLAYEFKFEKELPTGIIIGVEHNGRTKNDVSFIYDTNKYFAVVYKNNQSIIVEENIKDNQSTINFIAEENLDVE